MWCRNQPWQNNITQIVLEIFMIFYKYSKVVYFIFSFTCWKQSDLSSHYDVCLLAWLIDCGKFCPLFTPGSSWCDFLIDWFYWPLSCFLVIHEFFLKLDWFHWLLRCFSVIHDFFSIILVSLTFNAGIHSFLQ